MKKIFYSILSLTLVVSLFSCEEEAEVWDSSTLDYAGNWTVEYNHAVYGEDPFGAGFTSLFTYNTAADNGQQIWLEDAEEFWDYKVRIPVSADGMTFGSPDTIYSIIEDYEIAVIVDSGRIVKDAVKLPSGVMADSIYFQIWFDDLAGATGIEEDRLLVSGYRISGFPEDDSH